MYILKKLKCVQYVYEQTHKYAYDVVVIRISILFVLSNEFE